MFYLNGSGINMHGNQLHVYQAMCDSSQCEDMLLGNLQFRDLPNNYAVPNDFDLLQKLEWCDSVWFHGGSTPNLIKYLRMYNLDDVIALLHRRTVVATSAGVSSLTIAHANYDEFSILHGIGAITATSIVHWSNRKIDAVHALKRKYPLLPVLCVSDKNTIIIG